MTDTHAQHGALAAVREVIAAVGDRSIWPGHRGVDAPTVADALRPVETYLAAAAREQPAEPTSARNPDPAAWIADAHAVHHADHLGLSEPWCPWCYPPADPARAMAPAEHAAPDREADGPLRSHRGVAAVCEAAGLRMWDGGWKSEHLTVYAPNGPEDERHDVLVEAKGEEVAAMTLDSPCRVLAAVLAALRPSPPAPEVAPQGDNDVRHPQAVEPGQEDMLAGVWRSPDGTLTIRPEDTAHDPMFIDEHFLPPDDAIQLVPAAPPAEGAAADAMTPVGPGCAACGMGGLVCSAHPDRPPAATSTRPDACTCGAPMVCCPCGCAVLVGHRELELLNRGATAARSPSSGPNLLCPSCGHGREQHRPWARCNLSGCLGCQGWPGSWAL